MAFVVAVRNTFVDVGDNVDPRHIRRTRSLPRSWKLAPERKDDASQLKTEIRFAEETKDDESHWRDRLRVVIARLPCNHELIHDYLLLRSCVIGMFSVDCLLYTSPSPRDGLLSRMPSSA